jgi:hypothetical protein
MIKTGILNPQINSLLSRVRHTNTLVIADRGEHQRQPIEKPHFPSEKSDLKSSAPPA